MTADEARDNDLGAVRGTLYGLGYSTIAWALLGLAWWVGRR